MIIKRNISTLQENDDERLFSTVLEQRIFRNKANRASRRAWEESQAKELGNLIFKNTDKRIDLSPNDELRAFRLKRIADVHGGVGDMISKNDPSRDFRLASDAVLGKEERNINHKINSKALARTGADSPNGPVKYGIIINDLSPKENANRLERMRKGPGKTKAAKVREEAKSTVKDLENKALKKSKTPLNKKRALIGTAAIVIPSAIGYGVYQSKKKKNNKKQ